MKKIITLLLVAFTNLMLAQSTGVDQVFLNSQTTITGCNTIDFGTVANNNMTFYYTLTNAGQPTGTLFVKFKYSSSTNSTNLTQQNIQSTNWSGGTSQSTIACSLSASQIQVTGSTIYLEFVSTSGVITTGACIFPLTKTPTPTFAFTPTSTSIACEDTNTRTFTVSASNIPNGQTPIYQWSYSGWTLISSTSTSRTLQPSSGNILPSDVSVSPSINGVAYPSMTCTITRVPFSSSATINGGNSICTPATTGNYSLTGLLAGQSITWSSSNTAVATVTGAGINAVVTKVSNGNFDLKATITNTCGQQFIVSKNIRFGGVPTSFDVTAVATGGSYDLTLIWPSTISQGLTSITWTKVSGTGTCGGSGLTGWADGSPTTAWTVTVKITATNDCGSTIIYKTYNGYGYSDPCASKMVTLTSKVKNNFIVSKVTPCGKIANTTQIRDQELIIAKVYNLSGSLVKEFRSNNFDLSDYKKGIYLINIVTTEDTSTTKVVVE